LPNEKNTSFVDTVVAIGCACNIEKVADTSTTISSNTQVQLQYFLNNDMINVVDAFRKKFSPDISLNMIDSFGNIKDNIDASIKNNIINKRKFTERHGDWICSKCKNLNFSFRMKCNRCQLSKDESDKIPNLNTDSFIKQNEISLYFKIMFFQAGTFCISVNLGMFQ
jgi:hypothetical protein